MLSTELSLLITQHSLLISCQQRPGNHLEFEDRLDPRTVIHCFDLFSAYRKKPALVVIDNAPIHTSEDFEDQIERWQKEDL